MKNVIKVVALLVGSLTVMPTSAQTRADADKKDQKQLMDLVDALMTSRGDEEQLRQLDRSCADALIQSNVDVLAAIEADGFTFTSPDGSVMTREQDLATIRSRDMVYDSIELGDVMVRKFGDATGIVTGKAMIKAKYRSYDISGAYRYTITFAKMGGRWRAAASQLTRIAG